MWVQGGAGAGKTWRSCCPKWVPTGGTDKDDLARRDRTIRAFSGRRRVKAELFLPWSAQKRRGEVFAYCEVLEERVETEGAIFRVRGGRKDIEALRERIGRSHGARQ